MLCTQSYASNQMEKARLKHPIFCCIQDGLRGQCKAAGIAASMLYGAGRSRFRISFQGLPENGLVFAKVIASSFETIQLR